MTEPTEVSRLRPQCRAHWPVEPDAGLDGRRCKFLLKQDDKGDWYCPAHGVQPVPRDDSPSKSNKTAQEGLDAFA